MFETNKIQLYEDVFQNYTKPFFYLSRNCLFYPSQLKLNSLVLIAFLLVTLIVSLFPFSFNPERVMSNGQLTVDGNCRYRINLWNTSHFHEFY